MESVPQEEISRELRVKRSVSEEELTKTPGDNQQDHDTARNQRAKSGKEKSSKTGVNRWTPEQDAALKAAIEEYGQRNWKAIAERVDGRNHAQCLQRWNKVLKPGLVKGHWSFDEDSILEHMVKQGCHSWGQVAANIPGRTAKQCRERWRNHLDPTISKAPYTPEEDQQLLQAYQELGNRWTQIADLLPGRTEDSVKLRWKFLNPNPKTKSKPGRPRLMSGSTNSKLRSKSPPRPVHVGQNNFHQVQAPAGAYNSQIGQPAPPLIGMNNVVDVSKAPDALGVSVNQMLEQPNYTLAGQNMQNALHMANAPRPMPNPNTMPQYSTVGMTQPYLMQNPDARGMPMPYYMPSTQHMSMHSNQQQYSTMMHPGNPTQSMSTGYRDRPNLSKNEPSGFVQQLEQSTGNDEEVLTQSNRMSNLSLGLSSLQSLSSFHDILPEELLASGDLDSLLKSGEIEKTMKNSSDPTQFMDSFSKAIASMENRQEQQTMQSYMTGLQSQLPLQGNTSSQAPPLATYSSQNVEPPQYHVNEPTRYNPPPSSCSASSRAIPSLTTQLNTTKVATDSFKDVNDPGMMQCFKIGRLARGDSTSNYPDRIASSSSSSQASQRHSSSNIGLQYRS